ncbi:unnamed protein product [Rotaria sp. Silwood2]|nr:unnamed protein product [Rotaria sp. Silwood2]
MTFRSFMIIIFVLLPIYSWCATSIVATNLSPANVDGLKNQFQTGMKSFSDIASLHYSLAGIKELGVQPLDTFCNDIKKLVDKSNIESIYHATEAAKTLTNCKVYLKKKKKDGGRFLQKSAQLNFNDLLG